jgi:archaellum component FlaC
LVKKIVRKIAEEVHRSKIEELEKEIAEMKAEHKVMNKTIKDNEDKNNKLEDRLWAMTQTQSKIAAALQTVLKLRGVNNQSKLEDNE